MRVLVSWKNFLEQHPDIAERWNRMGGECSYPGDTLYDELIGERTSEYWEHADEYDDRAWRISGTRLNLIVEDLGNGWSFPMAVEMDVDLEPPALEEQAHRHRTDVDR